METGDKIWVEGRVTRMPNFDTDEANQSYGVRTSDGQNIDTNVRNVCDPSSYKEKKAKRGSDETKHLKGPNETK